MTCQNTRSVRHRSLLCSGTSADSRPKVVAADSVSEVRKLQQQRDMKELRLPTGSDGALSLHTSFSSRAKSLLSILLADSITNLLRASEHLARSSSPSFSCSSCHRAS
eukprot:3428866-Pleurochrysis_carterae.AAC.1